MKIDALPQTTKTYSPQSATPENVDLFDKHQDIFEPEATLTFRNAEIVLASTAKELRKIKVMIQDLLPFFDKDAFPDALVDAALELHKLKYQYYELQASHDHGSLISQHDIRQLRKEMHHLEKYIASDEILMP